MLLVACSSTATTVPATTVPAATVPATTVPATTVPATTVPDASTEFAARVVLTRQRDLVDRGLVNVFTLNTSDDVVVITRRELVATAFASPGPATRTSRIPAGREVALQIAYGDVVDCADPAPVAATLVIEYTAGDDPTARSAEVPLSDATVLDTIRANACTARAVHEAADLTLSGPEVVGETVTVALTIDRHDAGPSFVVRSIGGTVLFGVRVLAPGELPLDLGTDPGSVTLPLEISVNRCDPHALAETTKRYAIDLRVSFDGADPRAVPLDVSALVPSMEQVLEACRARTA